MCCNGHFWLCCRCRTPGNIKCNQQILANVLLLLIIYSTSAELGSTILSEQCFAVGDGLLFADRKMVLTAQMCIHLHCSTLLNLEICLRVKNLPHIAMLNIAALDMGTPVLPSRKHQHFCKFDILSMTKAVVAFLFVAPLTCVGKLF